MKFWQVTEDLGDGDVAIRNFHSKQEAEAWIELDPDGCWHESNPHEIDTDNIRFTYREE
jgi:hypothetical protein